MIFKDLRLFYDASINLMKWWILWSPHGIWHEEISRIKERKLLMSKEGSFHLFFREAMWWREEDHKVVITI